MSDDKSWTHADRHLLASNILKTATASGLYRDGGGLYLEVDEIGRRWFLRLQVNGKRRQLGLGSATSVSLSEARTKADELRAKCKAGIDPVAEREEKAKATAKSKMPTFRVVAQQVYEHKQSDWSNGKHQAQWISTLTTYAFPEVGDKLVSEIDVADILKVLKPIWSAKAETARRVKQRLEAVFDWCIVHKYRSDNPATTVTPLLGNAKHSGKHHRALPYADVGKFIVDLKASTTLEKATKLAFEFLILTAVRSNEVQGMVWSEIDLGKNLWTIPAKRMKAKRDHVVPLCDRAVEILEEAADAGNRHGLVFKDAKTGRQLSENRFLNARDTLGYSDTCTPHGFRSSFRDWSSEETNFPSDVCEMALAHAIKDKAEAAYRRGELLEKRRSLMNAWASYVAEKSGRNVIGLPMRASD